VDNVLFVQCIHKREYSCFFFTTQEMIANIVMCISL